MRKTLMFLTAAFMIAACSQDPKADTPRSAAAPTDVAVEVIGTTAARLTWTDNSDNETGFGIYFCPASNVDSRTQIDLVGPDETEYVLDEGLEVGRSYYLGVQAKGESSQYDSRVINVLFSIEEEVIVET